MFKGGKDEIAPDLDLVADVIEHIDIHGKPGNVLFAFLIIPRYSSTMAEVASFSSPGAVLCFLPGWQDIKAVQEKLEGRPHFSSGSQMILPCKSTDDN